jgi:hypothetical protein
MSAAQNSGGTATHPQFGGECRPSCTTDHQTKRLEGSIQTNGALGHAGRQARNLFHEGSPLARYRITEKASDIDR